MKRVNVYERNKCIHCATCNQTQATTTGVNKCCCIHTSSIRFYIYGRGVYACSTAILDLHTMTNKYYHNW